MLTVVSCCDTSVGSLRDSLGSGQDAMDHVTDLIANVINLIDTVIDAGTSARDDTTNLMRQTNTICPSISDQICEDILDAEGCDYDGIPFGDELRAVVEYFQGVKDMTFSDLDNYREDLLATQAFMLRMKESSEELDWAFYTALSFTIALAVLCLFLMIGIIGSWLGHDEKKSFRYFRCFRRYLVLPLFGLLVALSFVFSVVFIIGSIGSADVCYNSPDGKILAILEKEQEKNSSIILEFLIYYISGCPEDFEPSELLEKALRFAAAIPILGSLSNIIDNAKVSPEDMVLR
jgi:hypothetical protein